MDDFERKLMDMYKKEMGQKTGEGSGQVCPSSLGQKCRLCDLCKEILFNKRDYPKGHPMREKASELNAKQKYYSNIIFLSNPTEVVIFEYGHKIWKQLLAGQMDETSEWRDFFNPVQGRNLLINKVPGATQNQAEYFVEPRMTPSPLPDPSVVTRMYNLFNILDLLKDPNVKKVRQALLPPHKTEIRVLPSWEGPKSKRYFVQIDWHFKLAADEFQAVLNGDANPFNTAANPQPAGRVITPPAPAVVVPESPIPTEWDEFLMAKQPSAEKPIPVPAVVVTTPEPLVVSGDEGEVSALDGEGPICLGEYDPDNTVCTQDCARDGYMKACMKTKALRDAKEAKARQKRQAARSVVK